METLKLLITDDEVGMRMGVERALRNYHFSLPELHEETGFEVSLAESGEQALEMIQADPPDILLLDHKLPGISGLDVLEKMRELEEAQNVVTVMITAYASLETAVRAIKQGAHDFLAKPFTPNELKSTVSKAAESLILARHARKLAREKKQVRFQFISVLAHELKAPLNAIDGYLNILKEQPEAANDQETFERMIGRCTIRIDQMRKLIVDLLETTRIESGQSKREFSEVNLVEVVNMAVETVMPDAAARNIQIEVNAPQNLVISGDRSELGIILNNLLSNAVKYNRDNGLVDVNILEDKDRVTLVVKDTGIGMTEEECAKLFGEFVRIKNEKTRNILGSGLGLSIVKKLARMYGGNATVTSVPDEGSTFRVTLLKNFEPQESDAGTPTVE